MHQLVKRAALTGDVQGRQGTPIVKFETTCEPVTFRRPDALKCHRLVRRRRASSRRRSSDTTQSGRSTRSVHVKRTTRQPARVSFRSRAASASTVELRRVVPAAVELDEQAGGRVGDVDPSDPGLVVAGIELADGFGKARLPDEVTKPGLQLARRWDVTLGAISQQPAHHGRALRPRLARSRKAACSVPGVATPMARQLSIALSVLPG